MAGALNVKELRELERVILRYAKTERITCPESVYQQDNVIENAYELIDELCRIVGVYEEDSDG